MEEIMHSLIAQVIQTLQAQRGFVVLKRGEELDVLAKHYLDPTQAVPGRQFSRTLVEQVATTGEPLVTLDALETFSAPSLTLQGVRSVLCAPLRWGGEVRGVVYADHAIRAGAFKDEHLRILSAIADQASRALETAALQEELRRIHQQAAPERAVEFALSSLEGGAWQDWGSLPLAPPSGIAISLFGPFRAALEGVEIEDWSTRKNRELLAYLATHRGQVVHEEKLMDLFWSQGGKKGLHSLHNGVTQLRKALGRKDAIERKHDGYTLSNDCWVDIVEFSQRLKAGRVAAREQRWDDAVPLLARAEALAAGEFLQGSYSDWSQPPRQSLEDDLWECRALLADHFHQHGRPAVAVELWKRALTHDSCSESAYRGLMEAYAQLGRQSELARTYQACCKAFETELQLPPPDELRELYENLSRV